MVRIPNIKIPSVRVGSIGPASNIGTGGATPAPPPPITYLTEWKIVGNSEVHGQEIWSCGEYSAVDGKYYILVLPQGGNVADIALDAPLRKVNDVADTIEFPSSVEGKALVTRYLHSIDLGNCTWGSMQVKEGKTRMITSAINLSSQYAAKPTPNNSTPPNFLVSSRYLVVPSSTILGQLTIDYNCISISSTSTLTVFDVDYNPPSSVTNFRNSVKGIELVYELNTPITETIEVPQIEEADNYTCVISQGAKAVEWSSFTTDSE